jgi:hypothetical protein
MAAIILLALSVSAWRIHPIHAARVEIDAAPDGTVSAVVHVYRDDFPAAVTLTDIGSYFDKVLVVTTVHGARVTLRATAIVPEGDRLRISLTGMAAGGLGQGHIALTLLQERFADQVNVVDARVQGRRAQLVFLRGDGQQALP